MKHLPPIVLLFLVVSCSGADNDPSKGGREDDLNPLRDLPDQVDNSRFNKSSFVWYLNERITDSGNKVTDIAAEMLISANNVDTVYFFTALGEWKELENPETEYQNFPEDTEITVYSESEESFFSIRQKDDGTHEVLHGGFDNGFAYAIVWQGDIWIEKSQAAFEIHTPEVVEVYTQYGTDL